MRIFTQENSIFNQQYLYLKKSQSLSNLFNLFPAQLPLTIPQNELTINLDNITLSPDQYTVCVTELQRSNMRIIYYCLLYYVFEKYPENEGAQIYQKLLEFIYRHKMDFIHGGVQIEDQRAKVYYIKYLYTLFRAKCKRKIVAEELSTIPQMDLLLLSLMSRITGEPDLVIEINGKEISDVLNKQLGFNMQFLNDETFIFQQEFVVDIRHFSDNCTFHIRHEKPEVIQLIREELNIGESAHFSCEKQSLKAGKSRFKVIKKSTIKSFGLVSEDYEGFEEKEELLPFGGILETVAPMVNKKDSQSQDEFISQFDQLINTHKNQQQFNFKIKQTEPIEQTSNQTEQNFNPEPQMKMATEGCEEQPFIYKGFNRDFNKKIIFPIPRGEVEEEVIDEFDKLINTQKQDPGLNPQSKTMIEKESECESIVCESTKSIKSFKSIRSTRIPKETTDSWLVNDPRFNSRIYKAQNVQFDPLGRHQYFSAVIRTLGTSQSTKLISSNQFQGKVRKRSQKIRVPTFILNRVRAKQAKMSASSTLIRSNGSQANIPQKVPRITFSYSTS